MDKNNLSQRLSATFLIVMVCFIVLFSINLTSAAEWDNVYSYNPESKTVTVVNWLGLGSDLAYITLTSTSNVLVARGEDRLVGEFNFITTGDFMNTFGDIYLEDVRSDKEISRGKQFKYKKYTNISVDDYETSCENITDINGTYESCIQVEVGNHWEIKMDWIPVNNPNNVFYSGVIYEIGVFVDVEAGDYGDWVPSIMGVEIEEWATWTESLNADIISYYKLDEISGTTAFDSLNLNNGTRTGSNVIINQTGIINKSYKGILDDGSTVSIPIDLISAHTIFSVSMWINTTSTSLIGVFGNKMSGAGATNIESISTINDGNFHNIIVIRNGINTELYVDGVSQGTANGSFSSWSIYLGVPTVGKINMRTQSSSSGSNSSLFKHNSATSTTFLGSIDEVGIWNRSLSVSEVTQLYNGGSGITFTDNFAPIITILFPQDITYNETLTELNYSVDTADRCWFSDDGGLTNSSDVAAGTNFTGLESVPLENNWTVFCNSSQGVSSDTVTFFINQSVQTELISPTDGENSTTTLNNFLVNSTPINTNLSNVTLYIWHNNGTLLLTNTTILSGNVEVQTNFTSNLTEANYIWNAETCGVEGGCLFDDNNRTLTIHITPSDIIIHFPSGTIDFFTLGDNSTLNWTISEAGQNLTEHVINCSYTYNNITVGLNQSQCIEINQTSFLYVDGVNNLSFTVLDEFGLTNINTTSWEYKVLEINQSYNNETTEGALETFLATIKLASGYSITGAVLINYNGSSNIGQSFTSGNYTVLRKINFLVPNVAIDTNVTFYWNITLSDSTNLNLNSKNQTIFNLALDNCSTFTKEILNFTVVDEEEQTILPNATIETAVNIYDQSRTVLVLNHSAIYERINPLSICLNINVSNNSMYSMDVIVRYEEEDHAKEYYNIVNATITSETESQIITLYDLNLNDSVEFQLTFTGSDFLPIENALINVDRQYISENTFKTVELPKTDYNGQSVLHLVRNDIIYNIVISKSGVVLGNFENLVAFCDDFTIGNCKIVLNAFDSVDAIFDYDSNLGIIFQTPEYNETLNLMSFNFITSDGTAKKVTLEVTRNDIFGNRSICNSSIVSSGATLSCSIPVNLDDSTLNTQIYVNDILSVKTTVLLSSSNYGPGGYLIAFVLALTLALLFSDSKTGLLVSMVLSLAVTIGLGITGGNMIGIGASGIWLLVIVIIGIYKLNKDRQP